MASVAFPAKEGYSPWHDHPVGEVGSLLARGAGLGGGNRDARRRDAGLALIPDVAAKSADRFIAVEPLLRPGAAGSTRPEHRDAGTPPLGALEARRTKGSVMKVDMARNLPVEASTVSGLGTARPSAYQSATGADQFSDGGKLRRG
jgi:hypothetical protein